MQFSPVHTWARGDVVLCGGNRWMVWQRDGAVVLAFRIMRGNRMRHRADVVVQDIPDLAVMGLPGGYYVVRVSCVESITPTAKLGSAAPAIILCVANTLSRERAARCAEDADRASQAARRHINTETCVRL